MRFPARRQGRRERAAENPDLSALLQVSRVYALADLGRYEEAALAARMAEPLFRSTMGDELADDLLTVAIPDAVNVVAAYPIAQLTGGHAPELGATFVDLVLSEEGRVVLAKWGFGPVDAATTGE